MPDQYNVKNPPLPDQQAVYRRDLLQETVRSDGSVEVDALGDVGERLAAALPSSPSSGGSEPGVPGAVFFADVASMQNLDSIPDDWASLEKYQLPTVAPAYFVSVRYSIYGSTHQMHVYVIRDEAHWNDFWIGDGNEDTQDLVLQAHITGDPDPDQEFFGGAMLVVPAGWYLVGRTYTAAAISRITVIPFGPPSP